MAESPIVVGYDGSATAGRALDRAIADAKAAGQSLLVVTVKAAPFDLDETSVHGNESLEPVDLKILTDGALRRAETQGVQAEAIWDVGDPMRVIVDAAHDHDASEVVLGGHHYSVLKRMLGEDVPAAVKRRVGCDVVVVE